MKHSLLPIREINKLTLLLLFGFLFSTKLFAACGPGQSTVVVTVHTDSYGYETTWALRDVAGNLIASGGAPSYGSNTTYTDTICIPSGTCVIFTIYDSFGDGICCAYGNGYYNVTLDSVLVANGGSYTNQESTAFNCAPGSACAVPLPVTTNITYTAPDVNYWYSFTPDSSGQHEITTCGFSNTCNTKIWVYNTCPLNYTDTVGPGILYNNDNATCGQFAIIIDSLSNANTYLIRISGDSGCVGNNIYWRINYPYPPLCTPTSSVISASACDNYVSPSGNYTWMNSGTYMDTIVNAGGCDSTITINLIITNSSTGSISPSSCYSYVSPSGNYTWTTSGTYNDTITNVAGCDSTITINLTILNATAGSVSASACNSYVSPSGNYTWSGSGVYMDTLPNAAGCDSIITVNLTILSATTSSVNISACDSYVSPSGNYTWTVSGTYTDTINNAAGCDSIITVNLTINTVDISVTSNSPYLSSNAVGANYQWLDCNNGFAPIVGETSPVFTALSNGSYAVQVTQNSCTDTSACIPLTDVGFSDNQFRDAILVYPNPTKGELNLSFGNNNQIGFIIIRNELGQEIARESFVNSNLVQVNVPGEAGFYFVEVCTSDNRAFLKVVKE